jgi:peptide-methionine (S)-S-oxide reductase
MDNDQRTKIAVFGGGCFWCTEAVFQDLRGVRSVVPGYAGGHVPNPTYQQVCTDTTGHAEVALVRYDPAEVSYRDLLGVFFATHDPTSVNRQGNDVGSQYRSVIFHADEEQLREAREAIDELERERVFGAPIVTQLEPLDDFYEAEAYHRNYFRNNPDQPYCSAVIAPKVNKFRQKYMERLRL